MKITKSQLKQIIKEELNKVSERAEYDAYSRGEGKPEEPKTEIEIYSMLDALAKQYNLLKEALEYSSGMTAELDYSELKMSDDSRNKIYDVGDAIRAAREALSKEIDQDPHPELASVREQ